LKKNTFTFAVRNSQGTKLSKSKLLIIGFDENIKNALVVKISTPESFLEGLMED